MGVIDALFIMHHRGLTYIAALMIIGPNHAQQMSFIFIGGPTKDKEGPIHLSTVNCYGTVLGRIRTQAAGVLVAIGELLIEFKPDAFIAVYLGVVETSTLGTCAANQQADPQGNHTGSNSHGFFILWF